MYINDYKDIPYSVLQYVIGECNYGGRIHDPLDHRLLTTIVNDTINIKVTDSPDYHLCDKFQVPLRFEYHDFIVSIQVFITICQFCFNIRFTKYVKRISMLVIKSSFYC